MTFSPISHNHPSPTITHLPHTPCDNHTLVTTTPLCDPRELYHQVDLGQYAKGVRVPVGLRDVVVLKVMCEVGVDADWRPWTAVEMYR